jgi:hypothetical protein
MKLSIKRQFMNDTSTFFSHSKKKINEITEDSLKLLPV